MSDFEHPGSTNWEPSSGPGKTTLAGTVQSKSNYTRTAGTPQERKNTEVRTPQRSTTSQRRRRDRTPPPRSQQAKTSNQTQASDQSRVCTGRSATASTPRHADQRNNKPTERPAKPHSSVKLCAAASTACAPTRLPPPATAVAIASSSSPDDTTQVRHACEHDRPIEIPALTTTYANMAAQEQQLQPNNASTGRPAAGVRM